VPAPDVIRRPAASITNSSVTLRAGRSDARPPPHGKYRVLFQSQVFVLVFLPLALLAYYVRAHSQDWREWSLLAASLVFYGWWDFRFIPLLVGQIGATWALTILHERTKSTWPLKAGVAANLASLGTFKYFNFVFASVMTALGRPPDPFDIVLPIGISFFSFQLISYLIDRMRNDAPVYPFRRFALFVMFFPHLIAGPIVRHNELIPQFDADPLRPGRDERIGMGLILFSIGFAKKVLLADRVADVVNPIFAGATGGTALTFSESWTAMLGFSLQIFLDFSAYTDMAIGIALLFGLVLPENFRRPYLAADIRDFWRRWHMSLSRFLRDYVYIPLGGSRNGPARFAFASIATMALCGLWHGAGWMFIAWGLWHGIGLVVCRGWQSLSVPLPAPVGWLLTMIFVIAGWILFRAPDMSTFMSIVTSMVGLGGETGIFSIRTDILVETAVPCLLIPSSHEMLEIMKRTGPRPIVVVSVALLAAYCVLEVGKGAPAEFIYFRF
jgi:D-alanyl-lipoteichoic acid acyltransferase DltB (MBOAT superfamily)